MARILYVEDYDSLRTSMVRMIHGSTQLEIVCEPNVESAKARLANEKFDLEIWDGNLNGDHHTLDGVVAAVNRHAAGHRVMIYSSLDNAEKLAKGRGVPFLFKPAERETILAKIEELTRK